MVKHIVCWRIKDDLDKRGVFEEMKIRVEAMNGEIPGLLHVELGFDIVNGEKSFDVALYAELENKSDLKVYQEHPKHLFVAEFIGAVTKERVAVDYQL